MSWIVVVILAYFFSAIPTVIDKYILTGLMPNPKVYAFYAGILGILALLLFPLVFSTLNLSQIILSLLAGGIFIFALFWFCKALCLFEASRVVSVIGGFNPIFVFFINYFISGEGFVSFWKVLSFVLLILGILIISREKENIVSRKNLEISFVSAFLFSFAFVLSKQVYDSSGVFWPGFIWMRIGGFLVALLFLFSKEVREEIFKKRTSFNQKTVTLFLISQGVGSLAFVFQSWGVALVPVALLAFVNALEATKYIFLLMLVVFFSFKFPQILKEEFSKKILFQKTIAILIIGLGLALLAFK